jgi:CHAT domain-containing protein
MDEPLIDSGAAPFFAAQAIVGRWVLRHGAKLPPPVDRSADHLAVVWGEYTGPRWRRLVEAELEAQHLKTTYGAIDVKAAMNSVLDCLEGVPPADLVHFAVHGSYDPTGIQDGLALIDGSFLEPLHVSGVRMRGNPVVFLNACQVGSGSRILGDYAGMAAAFLSAGASAVIAPLWSVKDAIARQIAEDFYERVFAGVPPADALRAARTTVPMSGSAASATGLAYQFFGHPCLRLRRG